MQRWIWLCFMMVAAGLGRASAQEGPRPVTLREAVRMALERFPEVLIAQAQLDELNGRITEVRSGAFPKVSFETAALRLRDPSVLNSSSFDSLPPEFRTALIPRAANLFEIAVTVKQPLYTAGKVRNAVRLAEETRKEKEISLESARQRVAFKVFQAFYDLLLTQENLTVTLETRRQREKHLEMAQGRFREGVATEIDVLRSQVNLANTEPELIRARSRVRLARAGLNNLIVVGLESPTEAAGKLEYRPWNAPPLEELQASGLEDRPEVQAARKVVEESRILLLLARAENKVGIDFDGRFGFQVRDLQNIYLYDFSSWNATFNLRIPLYDGGRKEGLVTQALARMRSSEQSLVQLENSVRLEIKAAFDDLQSSAQAIAAAALSVGQAERVLSMMQANYRYGAATTLDVMDSQTALTVALNSRINATYDCELARARVRLATGKPVIEEENQP